MLVATPPVSVMLSKATIVLSMVVVLGRCIGPGRLARHFPPGTRQDPLLDILVAAPAVTFTRVAVATVSAVATVVAPVASVVAAAGIAVVAAISSVDAVVLLHLWLPRLLMLFVLFLVLMSRPHVAHGGDEGATESILIRPLTRLHANTTIWSATRPTRRLCASVKFSC